MQRHGENKDLTQPSSYVLQVLVLVDTETLPWREDVQRTLGHIIGKQLQLGPGGSQAQKAFCTEVMSHLLSLLLSSDYAALWLCLTARAVHAGCRIIYILGRLACIIESAKPAPEEEDEINIFPSQLTNDEMPSSPLGAQSV
jgi:hypothetical protein